MPTEELEHELRRTFARAAAGYQNHELARQRLLRHDYRPAMGHRRIAAGAGVVAAASAVALGLGLSGALSSAPASTTTIKTAAFTLTRNADGTDTLTIDAPVLFEPETLQADLAQYGIPAKVTTGSFCSTDPAPGGFSQAVSFNPPFRGDGGQQGPPGDPTVTIDPAAIPAGAELSVGTFSVPDGEQTAMALIDTNSYTCTTAVLTTLPQGGALLHWGAAPGH